MALSGQKIIDHHQRAPAQRYQTGTRRTLGGETCGVRATFNYRPNSPPGSRQVVTAIAKELELEQFQPYLSWTTRGANCNQIERWLSKDFQSENLTTLVMILIP